MEKEFSFLEMLVYCFRKWIIIVVAAVLGAGASIVFSVININMSEGMIAEGTVSVAGIGSFYDSATDAELVNYKTTYEGILERGLDVMVATRLKTNVYEKYSLEFGQAIKKNSKAQAEQIFNESLTITKGSYYITVSMRFQSTQDEDSEFYKRIVTTYMADAAMAAKNDEARLLPAGRIIESDVHVRASMLVGSDRNDSILTALVVGLLAGVVLGLVITAILYFADGKVKSYRDIAPITGSRLLGLGKEDELRSACPKLDLRATEQNCKVLLMASIHRQDAGFTDSYVSYLRGLGRNVLCVRTAGGSEAATDLTALLASDAPLTGEKTELTIERATAGRLLHLSERFDELKKHYDTVVLDVPYAGDGILACFASVCDGYTVELCQTKTTMRDVAALTGEIASPEKALGAIITEPGKSYVGRDLLQDIVS